MKATGQKDKDRRADPICPECGERLFAFRNGFQFTERMTGSDDGGLCLKCERWVVAKKQ